MVAYVFVVILLVLLGSPHSAFAWGPATHVGLAAGVLERLSLVPAGVAALLARQGIAYLYGNIAADIVFAKRWSRVKQFCHHWSTGFKLLEHADDEPAEAFAYGYLSHLAADTVAHGKFIPRQIAVSRCSINAGHFFWELRADGTEADPAWQLLEHVIRYDHSRHHEALEKQITGTFLSFDVNRLIFDGMNALAVRRSFRRTVEVVNRRSRWHLPAELVQSYRAESLERILSLLTEGRGSAVLREDPNGSSVFASLCVRRREVRRLQRRGVPVEQRWLEMSRGYAPQFNPLASRAGPVVPSRATIPIVAGLNLMPG